MGGSRRWWRELPKSCCCLAVQKSPHCLGCSDKTAAESLDFDNFVAGSSGNLGFVAGNSAAGAINAALG